jgi:hypothetical protein
MDSQHRPTRNPVPWARRSSPVPLAIVVAFCIVVGLLFLPSTDTSDVPNRRTPRLIYELDVGISHFEKDFGQTPDTIPAPDASGDVNRRVRRWLTGLDNNGDPDRAVRSDPRWQGPYVEPDWKSLDVARGYILVDSWGNPILFEFDDPVFNPGKWDVWSLGRDGKGTSAMADVSGATPEERRQRFEQLEWDGRRVNADTIGNWD